MLHSLPSLRAACGVLVSSGLSFPVTSEVRLTVLLPEACFFCVALRVCLLVGLKETAHFPALGWIEIQYRVGAKLTHTHFHVILLHGQEVASWTKVFEGSFVSAI